MIDAGPLAIARLHRKREAAREATEMHVVAIVVYITCGHHHGGKMRGLKRGYIERVHRIVRCAINADLAIRPRLHTRPLDDVVVVVGFRTAELMRLTGNVSQATALHVHDHVTARHPIARVRALKVFACVHEIRVIF